MKSARIHSFLLISATVVSFLLTISTVKATDLDSTNYKIVGATTTSGGGLGDSTSYSLISTVGEISADPRLYSTSYRLQQDPSVTFLAAQPIIQCFETTGGTSLCTTGPSGLTTGGMNYLCGPSGCYDRARFEIDAQGNPTDTLYGVEISTDNFITNRMCIDGSTFRPDLISNCNISDFRTKSDWESPAFNILGLNPNTTYYLRITAIHGDFTQSDYSSIKNATTGIASITFDIDIAPEANTTAESASPYAISFTGDSKIIAGAAASTATDLIWLDLGSSSFGGTAILGYSKNGGLYSPTTTEIITSSDINLDNALAEGFGLQSYYISFNNTSSYYGAITATTSYAGTGNTVGGVLTASRKIYESNKIVVDGRVGMYAKARVNTTKTPATDYSETIYFTLVPLY